MNNVNGIDPRTALPVRCISIRESMPNQVTIGHLYMIDQMSIWLDDNGDAFGVVYDMQMQRVGQMKLSHFSCV